MHNALVVNFQDVALFSAYALCKSVFTFLYLYLHINLTNKHVFAKDLSWLFNPRPGGRLSHPRPGGGGGWVGGGGLGIKII